MRSVTHSTTKLVIAVVLLMALLSILPYIVLGAIEIGVGAGEYMQDHNILTKESYVSRN